MKKIIPIVLSLIIPVIVCLTGFSSILPVDASGAFFYLSPSTGTKSVDTVFFVTVKLNTGEAVVNAAEGTLNFDPAKLEAMAISKNNSVFSMWTSEPSYNNSAGTINFSGGIPRPGYSGKTGNVITISFKAKSVGDAQINFSSGAILANDGLGTNILTSMGSASYTISPKSSTPKDEVDTGNTVNGSLMNKDEIKTEAKDVPLPVLSNELSIVSPSHSNPSVWYSLNKVDFKWNLPVGATEQSYTFDNSPLTDPKDSVDSLMVAKSYENVKDGIWYFHLKIKDTNGWSKISHYRVQIDTVPPAPFKVSVNQENIEDLPILFFKTVDESSGIVSYQVNIGSLEEKAFDVDAAVGELKVPALEVGPHTAMIKAIDRAGNETFSTVDFAITPIAMPVIKNYSQELRSSDKFFISGTAINNVDVTVYIQKGEEKAISKKTISDKNGNWYLILDEGLANGRYVAWVEASNSQGIKSEPSTKISFLVTPPVFARIGSLVINYFSIIASLLFMIILIVASGLMLSTAVKKRLKKETFEVEDVLRGNMEGLKELIDEDVAKIAKAKTAAERTRLKTSLKRKIDSTEQKIMKEVKDIENLLK